MRRKERGVRYKVDRDGKEERANKKGRERSEIIGEGGEDTGRR